MLKECLIFVQTQSVLISHTFKYQVYPVFVKKVCNFLQKKVTKECLKHLVVNMSRFSSTNYFTIFYLYEYLWSNKYWSYEIVYMTCWTFCPSLFYTQFVEEWHSYQLIMCMIWVEVLVMLFSMSGLDKCMTRILSH